GTAARVDAGGRGVPGRGRVRRTSRGDPPAAERLGPVSKCLAGLRRAQTTTGRVGVSSGYNTGIQTKRRLAGSPPGPRLGSTEHFETGPSGGGDEAPAAPPRGGPRSPAVGERSRGPAGRPGRRAASRRRT